MPTSVDDKGNRKELIFGATCQVSPTTVINNGSEMKNVDEGQSNDVVKILKIDENILKQFTREEAMNDAENFAMEHGLAEHKSLFRRAALVARDGDKYESIAELTEEDWTTLFNEIHHRWKQPWALYFIAAVNAMAAVVQGMDETVVNGAQLY
jgi:hypothetical protein